MWSKQKGLYENCTTAVQREERIQQLGRVLLERSRRSVWRGSFYLDRLVGGFFRDENLRIQVLRFVDVLPTLDDDLDLIKHLQEYFGPPEIKIPLVLGWALFLTKYSPALTARVVRKALLLISTRYIGGSNAQEVMDAVVRLRDQKVGFSLDLLGESVVSETEANHYQKDYIRLIEECSYKMNTRPRIPVLDQIDESPGPGLYLSLKMTSLYSQVSAVNFNGSVDAISERLRPILLCALKHQAFVCIDMEQYQYKAIILEAFKKLLLEDVFRNWRDVGIALQAYLRETRDDLTELIQWAKQRGTPVTVRLVRGAYWDYETVVAAQQGWTVPVWTKKAETDLCYEQCLEALLDGYPIVRTAVATHNFRSVACAMAMAEERELNANQFEFQMLYGMAPSLQKAIATGEYCLRVYVPFGEPIPGMAYLVRRLLENSSSQSPSISNDSDLANLTLQLAQPVVFHSTLEASCQQDDRIRPMTRKAERPSFVNEPLHRFTDQAARDSIRSEIDRLRGRIGKFYPLRLNGEAVETSNFVESINPANPCEVIGRVNIAEIKHVDLAVAAANEASGAWATVPMIQRAALLSKAAGLLRQRRDQFAALEILEAGKTWCEADENITEAIDFLEYYAREAVWLDSPDVLNVPGENNVYRYSPLGVGIVIPPWNFPLAILTGMLSAALVSGNTVILKPSSQTPVIAAHFVDLLTEVGVPVGVVQYLPGPGPTIGQALVEHNNIQFVVFTGSEAVGTSLIESASRKQPGQRQIKRVIAEMGGKNAIIVDRDAEPDDAINGIIASAFGYQGQKCSACSRLIVVGSHYRALLTRLVDAAKSLKIGNPEDPAVRFGPVIESAAVDRINEIINQGKQIAKLELAVDCAQNNTGFFVGPAIFSDVPPDSALFRKEIFGPVLSVLQADSLDQAIEFANDSRYALTGGVYSRSPLHITHVKQQFEVGNLYINRGTTGALVGRQPFGGFRMSGVGNKAGGRGYLAQFMNPITVTENTLRRGFAPGLPIDR